jgi:hypothetical protein
VFFSWLISSAERGHSWQASLLLGKCLGPEDAHVSFLDGKMTLLVQLLVLPFFFLIMVGSAFQ